MQQKNIGIRRAGTADAARLTLISQGSATGSATLVTVDRWLRAPGIFSYVAEDEDLFGFVTVGADSIVGGDENSGQVLSWAIDASHRQRGMGRKLLVHGLSVLKRRMFQQAVIWLSEESDRAQRIVLKLGFEPNGAERWDNLVVKQNNHAKRKIPAADAQAALKLKYACYARDLDDFY